jgi:hypothetical protein
MSRSSRSTAAGVSIPTFRIHGVRFCLLPACLAAAVPNLLVSWAEWSVNAYDGKNAWSETTVGWVCPDMPTERPAGEGRIACVADSPGLPLAYIGHVRSPRDALRMIACGSYGHLRHTGRPRTARPGQAVIPR